MVDIAGTKEQVEVNISFDKVFHSKFDEFNGRVMCHYDVPKNLSNTQGKSIENILKNHHSAICVTDSGHGIAFDIS